VLLSFRDTVDAGVPRIGRATRACARGDLRTRLLPRPRWAWSRGAGHRKPASWGG